MFSNRIEHIKRIIQRATPQIRRPFWVGCAVLGGIAVLVMLGLFRTESFFSMPSSLEGIAVSQAIWGLKPSNLLMVLPIGSFLVVLARSFIGLRAFGLFTPMLIALAFLQIGPIFGPIVLCASVAVGMALAPSLLKLRMTRVGFLGVLISLIVFVLVALQIILDKELQVDAFPVVVCALVVERWWRQWEKDGAFEAARIAFNTLMISIVVQFVMVSHFALMLIDVSPLVLPGIAAIAIAILGRYRGLRLTEIGRFAPIWLEERRNARLEKAAAKAGAAIPEQGCGDPSFDGPVDDRQVAAFDSRDLGHQPAQRDYSEGQSPFGYRARSGQGRRQIGAHRTRYSHDTERSRYLRLWGAEPV